MYQTIPLFLLIAISPSPLFRPPDSTVPSLPFPTKTSSLIIVISKHLDYAFFLLAAKVTSVNN